MTRILLVHQPTDGGVGRHVSDLAGGLRDAGHDVVTCGPSPPEPINRSIRHVRLQCGRSVDPLHDAAAVVGLTRIIHRMKPDIVHAHSSKAGAVARVAKLLAPGPAVVYSPHGYAFAGYFSHPWERYGYRAAERLLAPLATRVACVCEVEAELARSVGPADRVRVIRNGVERAAAGPIDERVAALAGCGPAIVTLTLLRPGKGVETLIDAVPALLSRHPQACLLICGSGSQADELRKRAASRGVAHAVHFLGWIHDPPSVLRGSDLFVLPSWAESFPYAVLEAMVAGVPVVATDVGGIREAITTGQEGLIVPPRDPSSLAAAISELLGDHARRRAMGDAARARVQREFTMQQMIDGIAGLYREVLNSKR